MPNSAEISKSNKHKTEEKVGQVSSLHLKLQTTSSRDKYATSGSKHSRFKTSDILPRAQMLIPQHQIPQNPKLTSEQFLSEVLQTVESEQKRRARGKIMQGCTNFQLLDAQAFEKHIHGRNTQVKQDFVDFLSQEDDALKGLINLSSSKERMLQRQPVDKIEQYVQNFCSPGSPVVDKSLKLIKPTKVAVQKVVENLQTPFRQDGITGNRAFPDKTDFNFKFDTLNSLNSQVINVGQDFLKKMSYIKLFKQKSQLDIKVQEVGSNPQIQYFLDCNKDFNLALPILEKVINNTLCLQNYTLLDGHCKSLAKAFGLVNNCQLKGILLANCGINGKQFGGLLEGLHKTPDLKSITYKQNMFSIESLRALEPFLQRSSPLNLAELSLIDVKISSKCCEELLLTILRENYIQKLSLVNLNLTERHFDVLLEIVRASQFLETLDLSWCEIRHQTYSKLFEHLSQNVELKSVVLQWNAILEEKEQSLHSQNLINQGEQETLTPKNFVIVEDICRFISNNPKLILVDLQHTNLSSLAIEQIGSSLPAAISLRSINLSGNPGINSNLIEKLRLMIGALPKQPQQSVKIFTKQDVKQTLAVIKGENSNKKSTNYGQDFAKPLVSNRISLSFQSAGAPSNPDELEKWIQLQEGIKMRNIQQISQARDLKLGVISTDRLNLTIFRKLGFSSFIENADQWCINDQKQESYVSDQHIFTMVIWNQMIGADLNASEPEVKHYKDQVGNYKQKEGVSHEGVQFMPQILGTFNDWQPSSMVDLMQFCMDHDPSPPDFVWQLVEEGKCRQLCRAEPDEMDEDEAQALKERREYYYRHQSIKVLKSIQPFKNPQFGLIDQIDAIQLQEMTNETTARSKFWLWMEFVKPGRHTFCVRTPHSNLDGIKTKAGFYVHKMWCQIRDESFPQLTAS